MVKLSDFIADYLAQVGIRHVFMLTGGGAMHLNHSLGTHPKLEVIFNHHEQASAMAAESYARLSNKMAVVNVTTGPGGINALNGVYGAWTDSIPMLILSGQVRYDTTIHSSNLNLRQLGDQELDIINCVKPITKYAKMVIDPQQIKYELQKAIHIASTGRQGPVWLDIPMNVQGSLIDETKLLEFNPSYIFSSNQNIPSKSIKFILNQLQNAKRPLIIAGGGVRLSGAYDVFIQLIEALQIPVTTAWNAHDVLYDSHPLYVGRPGTVGDRAGNFAVQNADLLLILGSRLNIRQIGYNWEAFARDAYKIMVDVDPLELIKPTLNIDFPVKASLAQFMPEMLKQLKLTSLSPKQKWLDWCLERKKRYPVVQADYWNLKKLINPYCFMHTLSNLLPENQTIITGDGTACVTSFQAMMIKKGQRLYTNSGSASMGYDLPAAIGACVASQGQDIICLAGDGSIQQNIQELASIAFHRYPIKIFILNNNGYHSIRQTQANFFGSACVGVGPESGLGFPSFKKLAHAYDLPYHSCETHDEMPGIITQVIKEPGPVVCEVMLTLEQQFAPKMSSKRLADGRMVSKPLEDLAPFLTREELAENMLVEMLEP
jgi:acetolactate synthase-1/2/3 large subunit